jgi:hypothetical protein
MLFLHSKCLGFDLEELPETASDGPLPSAITPIERYPAQACAGLSGTLSSYRVVVVKVSLNTAPLLSLPPETVVP